MNNTKKANPLERIVLENPDAEFLSADGFDYAVIGFELKTDKLIYSYQKCLDILVSEEAMSYEDAVEWMGYNVMDSYMGDKTPIWCIDN